MSDDTVLIIWLVFVFIAAICLGYPYGRIDVHNKVTYSCTHFHKYEVKEGVWITCEVVK